MLDEIFDALAEAVAATSLRQVAQEVGMSPTGLSGLIERRRCYFRTRLKLLGWFARPEVRARLRQGARELSPETASAALDLLTRHLPLEGQRARAQAVLAALAEETRAGGGPVPSWLRELEERIGRGEWPPGQP